MGPTELTGRAQVTFLPLSMFIGRLNLHFISVCFALKNCLVLDLLGIAFGHLYFHLDHTGKLKPPGWVEGWYRESPSRAAVLLREEYVRRRGGAEGSGANAKRSIAKRANAKRANAKRTNAGRPREKRQKLSGGSAAHVRRVLGHTCVAHVLYRPHSRC